MDRNSTVISCALTGTDMSSDRAIRSHESAYTVQCRVLHALILRELKARYGNRRLGYMWALLEPLMLMSILFAGFQLLGRDSQAGIQVPLFLVTGFGPFFMFRDVFAEVMNGTRGHQSLLMFPQVTRLDLVVSKMVLSALIWIVVFITLLIGLYFLGFTFNFEDPLGVMVGFALIILLGLGLGLLLGAISIRYEVVQSISQPLLGRPLFFTSGLFFTASMLPAAARDIMLYNPLLHCIEMIRASMFESFESRYIDLGYVIVFALILVSGGLMSLMVFEKQRGSL